ncbi:YycH family regulatory protein [Furfurilactobacillus sp. WILCCON 0119]|uniref:YycH family regulatory protein n=1 Tax=Furfurilactobacillus entadae TaxID=2922307 RepID=UPI0035EDE672
MWTKLKHGILPMTLFVLVLISVGLSLVIWTNPARYDRSRTTTATSTTRSTVTTRTLADIYLPTQVIVTNKSGQSTSIYNPKVNLVTTIRNEIKNWRMTNFRKVSQGDKKTYEQLLAKKNMVQLNYADNIGRSIFNDSYNQQVLMSTSARFSRIVFSTTKPGEMYLLNDDNQAIYQISVAHQQLKQIRTVLADADQRYPVTQTVYKDHTLTCYTDPVKVAKYSYLVGQQNESFFVTTLLNAGEASSVNVRRSNGHTIYFDGSYKRLTVTDKTGATTFEDYNANNHITKDLGNNLKKSFSGLTSTGLTLDSIRYFNNEDNGRQVTYRSYVEGFPIFNQTDFGAVQVKNKRAGTEEINFTLTNLQVPLPTDSNSTETLPATQTVLDQLAAVGVNGDKIKDIVLGYEWENNYDSKQVVDLQPTYYVYLNGKWQAYQDVLTNQQN